MLEHSLKQERVKLYRALNNGKDPEPIEDEEQTDVPELKNDVPLDIGAVVNPNEDPAWKRARLTLKQYLEEMNYSDALLNVRAFRASKLIGKDMEGIPKDDPEFARKALDETEKDILDTANFLRKYNLKEVVGNDLDDENEHDIALDDDAVQALDEFSFLNQDKEKTSTTKKNPRGKLTGGGDEWGIDETTFNEMKERYRLEQQKKRQSTLSQNSDKSHDDSDSGVENKVENFDESNLGFPSDGSDDVDIKDDFALNEDDGLSVRWNLKYTLRSHYDGVRALQFHPVEPVLITAGEDGTAKLWNLSDAKTNDFAKSQANSPSGITDIEPVYTFRGHETAILAIDMSPTGDNLYTADLNGVIQCWQVPSANIELHGPYDPNVMLSRFTGHKDAVWSVNYHSSTNRLLSGSADSTIKIWDLSTTEESEYLLKSIDFSDGIVVRSMDIVSAEPQQLVVAFSNGKASIIDIETGDVILSFEFPQDENVGVINKILSHPTMPVTVLAGEDRKIRYFDNHTGQQIYGAVAHVEAISTLAIDPNGLYLMSGSHDGSLRIWNMEQKKCLQEIAAHRKKFDMSVLTVAFHPSRPLIGSAGADSLTKIFMVHQKMKLHKRNMKWLAYSNFYGISQNFSFQFHRFHSKLLARNISYYGLKKYDLWLFNTIIM
uniref:Striatin n=1 Tax=Panagrolaimus sp. JU765 TaxID=591449 RepID=A0AC34R471_9BILA